MEIVENIGIYSDAVGAKTYCSDDIGNCVNKVYHHVKTMILKGF
jgi:hypothetical protein